MTGIFPADLYAAAEALLSRLRDSNLQLAVAESCTGGLIAGVLTEVPGSSDVFDRGFVTYSNDAKQEMLGVHRDLIENHGAVSSRVARAMADGALTHSGADVSVAVTGVAGPGGGTVAKPVGLVHLAAARIGTDPIHREIRLGDIGRPAIRLATVREALNLLSEILEHPVGATPE